MKYWHWNKIFTLTLFVMHTTHALSRALHHRRTFLNNIFAASLFYANEAKSAETIGKDPDCNDASCLGVWDGLLADCPHGSLAGYGSGCVSSQDDTPGIFAEPWDYSDFNSLDWEEQMKKLVPAVQLVLGKRGDIVDVEFSQGRYLRTVIKNDNVGDVSRAEFYFTENDTTVQFRIGSVITTGGRTTFGFVNSAKRNMERAEEIRKYMRFTKLPVLRNRQRRFLFGETELDTFGPGSASLGPPAEMSSGELEGRLSSNPDVVSALVNNMNMINGL